MALPILVEAFYEVFRAGFIAARPVSAEDDIREAWEEYLLTHPL